MVLATGLVGVAYVSLLLDWCGESCRPSSRLGYLASGSSGLYVVLSWVAFYVGIKYWRQLQQQTRHALAANAMAHQAQLKMLRYQLNPHFLFNTLNAISTLVLDRQNDVANRMVQGLSGFLRHSLDSDPMQRVTLKQELDALNLYLGIEKIRFAERLQVETRVAPECYSALLPSLLLQPLVENAIKHGLEPRTGGGTVWIRARRDGDAVAVTVADNGEGFNTKTGGTGIGLKNVRERLRLRYAGDANLSVIANFPAGVAATITVPTSLRSAPHV